MSRQSKSTELVPQPRQTHTLALFPPFFILCRTEKPSKTTPFHSLVLGFFVPLDHNLDVRRPPLATGLVRSGTGTNGDI